MGFPKPTDASSLQGVAVSVVAPASGDVLQYGGSSWGPVTPAPETSPVTVNLAADLAITAATLTNVVSLTLAVGTWLVTGSVAAVNGAATAGAIEAELVAGTATATFAAAQSAADELPAISGGARSLALAAIVTVTVAGTVILKVECANACTAKAATPTYAFPGATGLAAVAVP